MKTITNDQLVASVVFINNLSNPAKLEYSDRIFANQPHLLGHALLLSSLGVSLDKIDHVLHLLLVFYHCFSDNEVYVYSIISEDQLLAADDNTVAMFKYLESEDPAERKKQTDISILNYPELNVFAYMMIYLKDNGFFENLSPEHVRCIRTIKAIFDCLCNARAEYLTLNTSEKN
jgi:hypothetical protein